MSFKISCPHCAKVLNVTEPAFGRTVSCPSCKQPFKVPHPAPMQSSASPLGALPPWSGTAQNGNATAASAGPLPAQTPPMPAGPPPPPPDDPLAFLRSGPAAASSSGRPQGTPVTPPDQLPPGMPKLPDAMRSCDGEWRRDGEKLDGRFRVLFADAPQQETEGTVSATIRDATTLVVVLREITWLAKPKNGTWTWRGKGEILWTKQERGVDEPVAPRE